MDEQRAPVIARKPVAVDRGIEFRHLQKGITWQPRNNLDVSSDVEPTSWTDPNYVATVIGVLAAGVLVFYAAMSDSGLTTNEVVFVILAVTLPATVAYEIARRRL